VDEVMTDHQLQSTIDAALDELAEAKPGPHFVPRLRAHVEESRRTMRSVGKEPLAFAAAVVLILRVYDRRRRLRHDPAPAARCWTGRRAGLDAGSRRSRPSCPSSPSAPVPPFLPFLPSRTSPAREGTSARTGSA
jgi:hypothetical protein